MMNKVTVKWAFILSFIVWVISTLYMVHLMKDAGGTKTMPDMKIGFTAEYLQDLRENVWGEEGCRAYVKANSIDLFPYMEAYTVMMWCFAIIFSEKESVSKKYFARVLATLPMCCDLVETLILRQTCLQREVSDHVVGMANFANQLKWISFILFFAILLPPWLGFRRGTNIKSD